jgi:hypothetical protein
VFTQHNITDEADGPRGLDLIDWDNDGDLDAFVASIADNRLWYFEMVDGNFSAGKILYDQVCVWSFSGSLVAPCAKVPEPVVCAGFWRTLRGSEGPQPRWRSGRSAHVPQRWFCGDF